MTLVVRKVTFIIKPLIHILIFFNITSCNSKNSSKVKVTFTLPNLSHSQQSKIKQQK